MIRLPKRKSIPGLKAIKGMPRDLSIVDYWKSSFSSIEDFVTRLPTAKNCCFDSFGWTGAFDEFDKNRQKI